MAKAATHSVAEPGADASWQPAPLLVRLADDGQTFAGKVDQPVLPSFLSVIFLLMC